jgi:hypothetical protein
MRQKDRLLRQSGLFVFDRKAVANILDVGYASTNPILDRLVRAGALTRIRRDRYALTEAMRPYARKIANEIVKPSALSLWTVLSDAGLSASPLPRNWRSPTAGSSAGRSCGKCGPWVAGEAEDRGVLPSPCPAGSNRGSQHRHPVFPASVNVLTYPLPLLLAGKMLAVLERPYRTPRDLYDLFWLLSRGVEEDSAYLRTAATPTQSRTLTRDRTALYRALLARVEEYADTQIASELGALLPRTQRRWASAELKERTHELLKLRLAGMEGR